MAAKKSTKATKTRISNDSNSSIKKKTVKPLSKKKQRALEKSTKVMIEKMNTHTTEDDIFNIIKSIETQIDTKAVSDSEVDKRSSPAKGLGSLETHQLRSDQAKDERIQEKEKAVQSDIAEQLRLINDFTL